MRPIVAFVLALAAVACSHAAGKSAEARIATEGGTVTVHVTIADTDTARERGLKGVRRLAGDAGMAFLFDRPSTASFWMKDTLVPLSIAFWGRNGRIIEVRDMAPCGADPCPTYRPDRPFVGALEVNRGFFAGHGVRVGDRVAIVGE